MVARSSMHQRELLEELNSCTISQLKEVEAKCRELIRKKRPNNGIESDILRIVERAPEYKIRLSESSANEKTLPTRYSGQIRWKRYTEAAVKLEPIPDEPRRRYGRKQPHPTRSFSGGRWSL